MGNFFIDSTAKLETPLRLLQGCIPTTKSASNQYKLPSEIHIGPYCVIGENVSFGEKVVVDSHCIIDPNTSIGDNTLLIYRAMIGGNTIVGVDCVIGGYIPENCKIGDRCRIFGKLVHTHNDTSLSWDHHEVPEISPTVFNDSFIGFDAIIAGDVKIGPYSYICAGAIVTKDVPPYHIASGVNNIIHYKDWNGDLANNPIFKSK